MKQPIWSINYNYTNNCDIRRLTIRHIFYVNRELIL